MDWRYYMLDTYGLENKFKISFNIILNENPNKEIYTSNTLDKSEETVEKRLFKKYTIVDSMVVSDKTYYLLKNKKSIIGWVNLTDSLVLFDKEITPVKVLDENYEKVDINSKINIELMLFDITRIYTSRYYVNYNNMILEVLMEKNKIKALIKTKDLDHSIKVNRRIEIDSDIKLYNESGMKHLIEEETIDDVAVLVDYFSKLNIARINIENKRYWVELDTLEIENIPTLSKNKITLQEVLYGHIVSSFQQVETKSKTVIKQLLNENRELIRIIEDYNNSDTSQSSKKYKQLESKYNNLKNSKLGKIQIAYWNYRNKRRD